jgi:site-specific DNA recombinase
MSLMALRLVEPSETDDRAYLDWTAGDATSSDPWWAIYARLSVAGDEEEGGIARQLRDCLEEAQRFGAKRVRRYVDHGFTASKRKRVRPQFERLLEDIAAGEFVGVVAWRAERLARQPRDAQRLVDALGAEDPSPRSVAYTVRDRVDTRTDQGIYYLKSLIEFGRWESKAIAHRVGSAKRDGMEKGRFTGSAPAFGHRDGTRWRECVPEEADLIREGAARVLAGEGVNSILRDYNIRGSRTRAGSMWQHSAWIKLITGPRMIGARAIGDDLRFGVDDEGRPHIASILDRDTWEKVRTVLLDPDRRKHSVGGRPTHLLTSLMRCGAKNADGSTCGKTLSAKGQISHKAGDDYWTYGCVRDAFRPYNCGRVWIRGDRTDEYIEQLVLAYLRKPAIRRALLLRLGDVREPSEAQAELRGQRIALQDRIDSREMAYARSPATLEAEHHISTKTYLRWREEAYTERDELDKRIARTDRAKTVIAASANPVEFWNQATLESRRDLVRSLFESIWVFPVKDTPGASARRWDFRRIKAEPIA